MLIVRCAGGIPVESLVAETARIFGLRKDSARSRILTICEGLVRKGRLISIHGNLGLPVSEVNGEPVKRLEEKPTQRVLAHTRRSRRIPRKRNGLKNLKPMESTLFDKQRAFLLFSSGENWQNVNIGLDELRSIMPPGVVSPLATRVAVWPPIIRALNMTASLLDKGTTIILMVKDKTGEHTAKIDLVRKLLTCYCPAFQEKPDRLCDHLLALIYVLSDLLLETHVEDALRKLWKQSKEKCVKKGINYVANWLYYFIRHVFPLMGYRLVSTF